MANLGENEFFLYELRVHVTLLANLGGSNIPPGELRVHVTILDMRSSDIRSYGKDTFSEVPDSPPMKLAGKIKKWQFPKPYGQWYETLLGSNKRYRCALVSLRNETGYWKQSYNNLVKAIFHWEPNAEKFRQRRNNLNVYDPRNSSYVYSIPPARHLRSNIAFNDICNDISAAISTSAGKDLPKMYIYTIDYKKSYIQLLPIHAALMKKVKKQKKLLTKIKSRYTEFIELTCFPSGLSLANEINASTKMATAFAPGFVHVVKDAPEKVDVSDKNAQGLPQGKQPTRFEPVSLSPPASPTRKRAAPLLVETPQKKNGTQKTNGEFGTCSQKPKAYCSERPKQT